MLFLSLTKYSMYRTHSISNSIFNALKQQSVTEKAGLLDGLTGESLYYFYRNILFKDEHAYTTAVEKLETAVEMMHKNIGDTSFFSGIAGIGWMVLHLNEQEIVDIDIDDFLDSSIDLFLYTTMMEYLHRHIYDFFFGASGICFYFFKKYQSVQDVKQKEMFKTYIMQYLFYMEFIKKTDTEGIFWTHREYPFEKENSCFELSSLSNVSSIILLLTEIATEKEFAPFCFSLIKRASYRLLHLLETTQKHRLDQGYCLWKASVLLCDAELEKKAFYYLRLAKKHIPTTDIVSQAKCAMIYQKIANTTCDNLHKKEALQCITDFSVGELAQNMYDSSIWKGYAGLGLIDFSLHHTASNEWSKCMLI